MNSIISYSSFTFKKVVIRPSLVAHSSFIASPSYFVVPGLQTLSQITSICCISDSAYLPSSSTFKSLKKYFTLLWKSEMSYCIEFWKMYLITSCLWCIADIANFMNHPQSICFSHFPLSRQCKSSQWVLAGSFHTFRRVFLHLKSIRFSSGTWQIWKTSSIKDFQAKQHVVSMQLLFMHSNFLKN